MRVGAWPRDMALGDLQTPVETDGLCPMRGTGRGAFEEERARSTLCTPDRPGPGTRSFLPFTRYTWGFAAPDCSSPFHNWRHNK